MKQTIVAEISKGWPGDDTRPLISQQFEAVIEVNRARGYILKDWNYAMSQNKNGLIETIIAVFTAATP